MSMLRKNIKEKKITLVCRTIKWHTQLDRGPGTNHTTCNPMAFLFGSWEILQAKWLLKCCIALLASMWITNPTWLSFPFIRNKYCLEEGHLEGEGVCFLIAPFPRQPNILGKQGAKQTWWHFLIGVTLILHSSTMSQGLGLKRIRTKPWRHLGFQFHL